MDIIIFSGQSNMQGQTESRPVEQSVENAWEYLYGFDGMEPLQHPVGETLGYDEKHFRKILLDISVNKGGNLVPAFCRAYLKSRDKVLAIHTALGATVIAEWQPETERYKMMLKKIENGIKKAKKFYEIDKISFVWLQGESDALIKTSKDEYLKKLVILKNALKNDVGIDCFGIIKVGYFSSLVEPSKLPYEERKADDKTIMEAQEEAVKTDNDFVMLTRITTEFSTDSEYTNPHAKGHYNNKAMEIIGTEAGTALAETILKRG